MASSWGPCKILKVSIYWTCENVCFPLSPPALRIPPPPWGWMYVGREGGIKPNHMNECIEWNNLWMQWLNSKIKISSDQNLIRSTPILIKISRDQGLIRSKPQWMSSMDAFNEQIKWIHEFSEWIQCMNSMNEFNEWVQWISSMDPLCQIKTCNKAHAMARNHEGSHWNSLRGFATNGKSH